MLNLDGVGIFRETGKPLEGVSPQPNVTEPGTPAAPAANPWARAEPDRTGTTENATPWQVDSAAPRWRHLLGVALRVAALLALLLLVVAGLRSIIAPPTAPAEAPVMVEAATMFPDADARAIATRFAEAYMGWSPDKAGERAATLLLDMPSLGEGDKAGWSGTGEQTAGGARAVSVDVRDEAHAVVTVELWVAPAGAGPRWTALAVPVEVSAGRVIVSALPAAVGIPSAAPLPAEQAPSADSAVTDETREYVLAFFQAYGQQDSVSALTAPSAELHGLGGLYTLASVTWTVYEGGANERTGHAVVQWLAADGALIEQPYTLTLVPVSSGPTSSWRISDLTASN